MRQSVLCHRWPARLTKTALSLALLTFMLASCTPVPKPTPQVRLGGNKLHFPLVMASPFQWQRTGYGRTWQSMGRDWQLHNRSMWSYTWGLGSCGADVPMVFSPEWAPVDRAEELMQRCAATAPVVLVLNEPEWQSQANTTPEQGARLLRQVLDVWGDGVYCCGNLVSHPGWMQRMVAEYKRLYGGIPAIDGVHVHVYANDGFGVADPLDPKWVEQSRRELASYIATIGELGLPARVIVSECCLLGKHEDTVYVSAMENFLRMLRGFSEVESVAWFASRDPSLPDSAMLTPGGSVTTIGKRWLELRWE